MRKIFLLLFFAPFYSIAQTPEAEELLVVQPVTDITTMNNIANPFTGSLVFNVAEEAFFYYDGTRWINTKRTVYSGSFLISSNGQLEISDVPFQPSRVVFVAFANVDGNLLTADNQVGNNNTGINNSFGYMTGYAQKITGSLTPDQQVICGGGSGNSIDDISRYASDSQCIGVRYGNRRGDQLGLTTATFLTFDDDGFTINVTNSDDNLIVKYTAFQ